MGVMIPEGGGFEPPQSEEVICPRCSSVVSQAEIKKCEWCELQGCGYCQKDTMDGTVCTEGDCGERLRRYQDNLERKWDERIARRYYE